MKNYLLALGLIFISPNVHAQNCNPTDDFSNVPGKYVDAANFEFPQQKAHWLDGLETVSNKTDANRILTQIEKLENNSRKNYILKGADLKMSFGTPPNPKIYYGKNALFAYDLNLGCYEYFCLNKKMKANSEYSTVFRAYINRYPEIQNAFTFEDDNPFFEVYNQNNGRFIELCNYFKLDQNGININNANGYYQDIPESSVKPGNRSTFMTRHWYFTKNNISLFIPVTRKNYLEALLVYYDREKLATAEKINQIESECAKMMKDPVRFPQLYENGKKNLTVRKAKFPDWQTKIETKKALVQKTLKENSEEWLSKPAIVKSKPEVFSWKNYYESGSNSYVNIDVKYADSQEDAQKTGSFTFSGFWDNKGGTTLYKYNPEYFKGSETHPAKPYFIELVYRYINVPVGKSLVENFTQNFDFDAIRKLLE